MSLSSGRCDRWMVIVGSFLGFFLAYGIPEGLLGMSEELARNFDRTNDDINWIPYTYYGFMLGSGFLSGILVQLIGCRLVTLLGCVLMVTGMLASMFVYNILQLYFTFGIVGGVGAGLILLPAIVIVMKHFEEHRSLSLAIASCGIGIGTLLMPILTRLWMYHYGWRSTFLFLSVLCMQGVISGFLYRREPSNGTIRRQSSWLKQQPKLATNRVEKLLSRWHDTSFIIKKNTEDRKKLIGNNTRLFSKIGRMMVSLRSSLYVIFVVSGVLSSLMVLVPLLLLSSADCRNRITSTEISSLTAVVSGIVARLFFGQICDQRVVDRMTVYIVNMAILGATCILSPLATCYGYFIPLALVLGICLGVFTFLQPVVLTDLVGTNTVPVALGIMMMFEGMVVTLGIPLTNWITEYVDNEYVGFYVAGSLFMASSLTALSIPFKRKLHFIKAKTLKVRGIHFKGMKEEQDGVGIYAVENQQHI